MSIAKTWSVISIVVGFAAATAAGADAASNPYVPPACTGIFTDVACPDGFAVNWIEKLYNDGITAGCGTNPLTYCPDANVTRAQMAVFIEKAMRGTSAWTPGTGGLNPMQIAMLQWYKASDIPAHFTAGGDVNSPEGLVFDGAHIWVANYLGNSVTELDASDGSKVGTYTAGGDISGPGGIAFDGNHFWVANSGATGTGTSVTELNASDGSKVGTYTAGGDIYGPWGLAFDGAYIWVTSFDHVTKLNASDGSKAGTYTAGGDIVSPYILAFDGAHIWVANSGGNSVTELNASDGSKVGTYTAGGDISAPFGLAFDGAHIWVGNAHSVTELNASDGSKVGTYTAGGDINGPAGLAFDGAHVWVANNQGNSLDKL